MAAPKRSAVVKPKRCRCIDQANKALDRQHHELALSFRLRMNGRRGEFEDRPIIETVRIEGRPRQKKKPLVATFCPFCGVKYPEPKPAPAGAKGRS